MGDVRTSLRALAHPGSVLALVVLVLNDHVLKQAWPGPVTGKLSDVAGLVVAPLLLAGPRSARRRTPAAAGRSGLDGRWASSSCKTLGEGAAVASAVWSLRVPDPDARRRDRPRSRFRRWPARGGSTRRARRTPSVGWRRTVAVGDRDGAAAGRRARRRRRRTAYGDEGCDLAPCGAKDGFTGTDTRQAFLVDDDAVGAGRRSTRRARSPRRRRRGGSTRLGRTYVLPQPVDPEVADVRCDASGVRSTAAGVSYDGAPASGG